MTRCYPCSKNQIQEKKMKAKNKIKNLKKRLKDHKKWLKASSDAESKAYSERANAFRDVLRQNATIKYLQELADLRSGR